MSHRGLCVCLLGGSPVRASIPIIQWLALTLCTPPPPPQVLQHHAAGARRNWFHLYGLLLLGVSPEEEARRRQEAADVSAIAPPVPTSWTRATAAAAAAAGGSDASLDPDESRYRHIASSLEAFVQTSTIGEFEARLRLLSSFQGHLSLRLQQRQQDSPLAAGLTEAPGLTPAVAANVAAALANTVRYYRQFSPAVRKWIEAGLTPLEKDLQVGPGFRARGD